MALTDVELRKVLVEENYLSEEDLQKAEQHSKQHDLTLRSSLFDLGLLTQELYEGAIAEHYKLPYYELQKSPPGADVVQLLPEEIARKFGAVVVAYDGKSAAKIATFDPSQPQLEEAVRLNFAQQTAVFPEAEKKDDAKKKTAKGASISFSFGRKQAERSPFAGKIEFVYSPQTSVEAVLAHFRKPLATRFQSIIEQQRKVAPEILEEILNDAVELRASDIHFEPQEKIVIVRFRVDGVMHEAGRIPREYYEGVVNRIKIAANMRIDEHFAAQDGAIRYESRGENVDVRVSIVPVVDGEKIVMRLLSQYVRSITLTDLGFSERNREILEAAAQKPFGMILTTGPTGSGKSTTLYALLKMRNHPDVNISTIEDPVEYKVPGINHIQVNPKTDLTFAKGLRALVRQDPDIVLVGEIRDGETADISVNAALTGHLLFSTLHANDAATAVPRLLDMGVEPFLLASTLEVVIAQRLMRRLCPRCRFSTPATIDDVQKLHPHLGPYFPKGTSILLYRGKGCEACGGTGYKGRIGIHELIVVTPEIEEHIIKRSTSSEMNAVATAQGMRSLFDDGFDKVKRGVTSLEELLRVAAPADPTYSQHGKKAD